MPKLSRYWLFQLVGWLCFAAINIYIALLTQEVSFDIICINILVSALGLFLTHLFRNYIRKHKLYQYPTEKLFVSIALSVLVLSIVYNVLYYTCLFFFYESYVKHLKPGAYVGSLVSVFFLFSVWSIVYFAWTYVDSNRKKLIEHLQMESAMKDLELKTIRSNLQPHFIFNSLNSIRALIDEDPELARKAITKISNILRSSITKQDATDSLENELKLVNDYLALEKIRFEERLSLTQDIDPASLPIQVPTMMLQTLVENAIKHGISSLEQGGRIHIKTSYTNHQLEIEVINSGTLNQDEANENSLGFGLSSTRQRLKLLYSNTSDLELFEQNGYVHVRVKIKTN